MGGQPRNLTRLAPAEESGHGTHLAHAARFQAALPFSGTGRPFSLRSFSMATRRNGNHGNGAGNGVGNGSAGSDYRFPASAKVYVQGTLHPDVRVPMREISLSPTRGHNGGPGEGDPAPPGYRT